MRKGQIALVSLMFGFMIIIMTLAIAPSLKNVVTDSRTDLDCTNTSLTAGETGTCIVVDWTFPYYVGVALLVGAGFIVLGRKALKPSQ